MSENRTKCHSYRLEYICVKCGEGMMETTAGISLMSLPPKYQHTCNSCGYEDYFFEQYPSISWVPAPSEVEE